MIKLSEESRVEFEKEANIIAQSLAQCVDRFKLEQAISFFQHFMHQALVTSSFEEEEYLSFANSVTEELKNKVYDKEAVTLLVNLSRIDSDVLSIYGKNGLNLVVAQAITELPDYFTTPFNSVMIFDYLYSHYYWQAQEVFRGQGLEAFLNFLTASLKEQAIKGEEIVTSILSSFMSIHFKDDKGALERIITSFGHIKSIEKKALKFLSQS